MRSAALLLSFALASCSVEKLPPIRMVHGGEGAPAKRVIMLPVECSPATNILQTDDPRAWCEGVESIVASELAFRGVDIVELSALPAAERKRQVIEVSRMVNGQASERREIRVTGSMYSDLDVLQQRDALAALGIDGVVRVSLAETSTHPIRALALVRVTRPRDASLIDASVCDMEVSRLTGDLEVIDTAVRCAMKGLR